MTSGGAPLPDRAPGTVRCLLTPASCQWTYTSDLAPARRAAWRMHYADHQRGEASLPARERLRSLLPGSTRTTEETPS